MLDPNAQIIRTWMAAMPNITSIRSLIVMSSANVKRENIYIQQQEDYLENVIEDLVARVGKCEAHWNHSDDFKDLQNLSEQMKISKQRIKSLRENRTKLQDQVCSNMYTLMKTEGDLYRQVDKLQVNAIDQTHTASQPGASPTLMSGPTLLSTIEDHSDSNLRDTLYSHMADVRILLDRLRSFEDNLRQELEERDALRASGHNMISDDVEFLEQSRIEQEELQDHLDHALGDVERLKRLCREKGIDFHDVQFLNPFPHETFYEASYSSPSTQVEAATLPLPESPQGILGSFFAKRELVKNWLKGPSNSDPQLTCTAIRETDERLRRKSNSDSGWVITRRRSSWPGGRRPSSSASSAGNIGAEHGMSNSSRPTPAFERKQVLPTESKVEPRKGIRKHESLGSYTTV
jgi:hypothetical protein